MFIPNYNKGCFVILILALVVCISIIVCKHYYIKTNNIIEQDIELQKHNDSLKLKVNNLDSIKNAKVIEVQKLDNDSTVKLFYELIK